MKKLLITVLFVSLMLISFTVQGWAGDKSTDALMPTTIPVEYDPFAEESIPAPSEEFVSNESEKDTKTQNHVSKNQDINGYGNTRWGMSPLEVIEALKQEGLSYEKRSPGIILSYDTIFGEKAEIVYEFAATSKKLFSVMVRVKAFFVEATRVLEYKYGKPTRIKSSERYEWDLPKTSIRLQEISEVTFIVTYFNPRLEKVNEEEVNKFLLDSALEYKDKF